MNDDRWCDLEQLGEGEWSCSVCDRPLHSTHPRPKRPCRGKAQYRGWGDRLAHWLSSRGVTPEWWEDAMRTKVCGGMVGRLQRAEEEEERMPCGCKKRREQLNRAGDVVSRLLRWLRK